MDRETEAAPRQAPPANGLPPIFQRPTYPPVSRPPARPSAHQKTGSGAAGADRGAAGRTRAARAAARSRAADTEKAPTRPEDAARLRQRPETPQRDEDRAPADDGGSTESPAPRRRRAVEVAAEEAAAEAADPGRVREDDGSTQVAERPSVPRRPGSAEPERREPRTGSGAARGPAEAGAAAAPTRERRADPREPARRRPARGPRPAASADEAVGAMEPAMARDAKEETPPRRARPEAVRSGRGTEAPARPERAERAERKEAPGAAGPGGPTGAIRGQKTLEEQVASGGPTRGLRSRTLRGRGGRRQREPQITPPRITDKLMVITEHGDRDQIAVLEENMLVQHYVTRRGSHSMVGNVYLGRIQNVLPGMEAAFVDIGRGRNGVLYAGEVNYSPEDLEGGRPPRIEQVLKSGQAVMVQVTKDPMGGKGARLTAQVSLPGRFLVLAPDQDVSGISRRLSDDARKRLKAILNKVKPKEHGVIVRTAAEGASEEEITQDLERLIALWEQIQKTAKKVKAPDGALRGAGAHGARGPRPVHRRGVPRSRDRLRPRLRQGDGVRARRGARPRSRRSRSTAARCRAFEEHRIVEQIHKALDRKVWLPSGGYLIIEQTEAMTIVDVNTGKAVGKTNLEETVLTTNLEAAREVARQLRLRDIGGIIVIDFIDLLLEQNKRKVEDTMREALAIDKTRSQVFEIGPLGIMQITRKRVSGGLVDSFSETCPTVRGARHHRELRRELTDDDRERNQPCTR